MDAERRFVNELTAGQAIEQAFLVAAKELRTTRGGDFYITCTLADRTGQLPARMWQASESLYAAIPVDGFLHVRGRTEDYRGTLQLIMDACRPLARDKVDLADYVATSGRDIEEMWAEMLATLRDGVHNQALRLLIKQFVKDPEFVAGYKRAPAAMLMHHPFIGGLLEHTLNVLRCATRLLPLYPRLNPELVLAGVFFHDMGKIAELAAATGVTYTDRGQLVGHITLGAVWLAEKAAAVAAETGEPFPARTLDLLQHIVLSHHGVYEYGSPKLPMIPEAYLVHYLDDLDAKMFITVRGIEADADPKATFTGYNRELQVRLYKRSANLDDGDAETGD